jgi:hypothetical protein
MALVPDRFKKLSINVGLAALAGFVTTFATLLNSTPKPTDKAAFLAIAGAAVFAAVRAVVGYLALIIKGVPAVPTDV